MWPFKAKTQLQPAHPAISHGRPETMALDSLVNFYTGMGTRRDQSQHSRYTPEVGIDRLTADSIFRSSWLGKRVITTIADDMTREWRIPIWDGSRDDDGVFDIQREETRLQVPKRVHSAIKWARMYGGCLIFMVTKDARTREDLERPLDVESVSKGDLVNLILYDRWRAWGMPPELRDTSNPDLLVPYLNQTLDDPNFGFPEYYYLSDTMVKIHHSRCVRFEGEELSWYEWAKNAFWHDSVYKSIMRALTSYDTLMAGSSNLVTQANIDVMMAGGLVDALATQEGTDRVLKRYEMLNLMKSVFGLMVLDKDGEELKRQALSALGGLRDVMDRFALDVSGAADVPVTRLFGQQPSGLNSDGESNLVNYEAHVKAKQAKDVTPQLNQLDQVLVRSALGRMPKDYRFEWNPLRQQSDGDKATNELKRAQRDKIYLDSKVATREAVAREVRASGAMPNFTDADVKAAKKADEDAAKMAEEMAKQSEMSEQDPDEGGESPKVKPAKPGRKLTVA